MDTVDDGSRRGPPTQSGNFSSIRSQHVQVLHNILQSSIDQADFKTASSVAAVLLDIQMPGTGTGRVREGDMTGADRDFDDLLLACAEILRHEPIPNDQLRSCLHSIAESHASVHAAEIARMALAMLLIEQGDLSQAMLVLELKQLPASATLQMSAVQHYTRNALMGLIKHHQLLGMLLATDPVKSNMNQQRSTQESWGPLLSASFAQSQNIDSTKNHQLSFSGRSFCDLAFTYNSRLWLKASSSRQVKETWRECERKLKEALAIQPASTLLSYALAHIYVLAGKFGQALDAAKSAYLSSQTDLDALSLYHLMNQLCLDHQVTQDGGSSTLHAGHEAAPSLVRALELDGSCGAALTGLLSTCSHCPYCMLRAGQGCLRYLDMLPVGVQLPLAPAAWKCLAVCLCGLVELMLKSQRTAEEPPSYVPPGYITEGDRRGGGKPSRAEQISLDPEAGPCSASGQWQLMSAELESRAYWWEKTVFGWGSSTNDLRSSLHGSTITNLGIQASVCCFMFGINHSTVQVAMGVMGLTNLSHMETHESEAAGKGTISGHEKQKFDLALFKHALELKKRLTMNMCKQMHDVNVSREFCTLPHAWRRLFPFVRRAT